MIKQTDDQPKFNNSFDNTAKRLVYGGQACVTDMQASMIPKIAAALRKAHDDAIEACEEVGQEERVSPYFLDRIRKLKTGGGS